MNYHNEMMNIREKRLDSQFASTESRTFYKEGHRDARHAAAEIALKADERIEELENALIFAKDLLDEWQGACPDYITEKDFQTNEIISNLVGK